MELFELLKDSEQSKKLLKTIENYLRFAKKWGRRGFIKELADSSGFSPAYVGQVFSGKKPLTERFVLATANYLGIEVDSFLSGDLMSMESSRTFLGDDGAKLANNGRVAHATLDTLLNTNVANAELLNSILNIFKYLPLEDLIDIRWELLNLVDKNSRFYELFPDLRLKEVEIVEKCTEIKKFLLCSLTSQVKIIKSVKED